MVHVLETQQLSRVSSSFATYNTQIFSSAKKAAFEIEQAIEINKGYEVEKRVNSPTEYYITYKIMTDSGRPFTQRYRVRKMEVK
jgi:hypothetical protein